MTRMFMKSKILLTIKILIVFILISFNLKNIAMTSTFSEEQTLNITKNLRCLICQGQSVYDSDSDFANSMKILVDKKLEEGLSENEIYDFFKEKYGDWILYDPGLNKNTYILWFMPLLIFFLGGAIIFKKLKKKHN